LGWHVTEALEETVMHGLALIIPISAQRDVASVAYTGRSGLAERELESLAAATVDRKATLAALRLRTASLP